MFTRQSSKGFDIDFLKQDFRNADTAWQTFIIDKSEGFTQAVIERINSSIRAYVWCILGAQAQTRAAILGRGKAFDAQKQYPPFSKTSLPVPLTSQRK